MHKTQRLVNLRRVNRAIIQDAALGRLCMQLQLDSRRIHVAIKCAYIFPAPYSFPTRDRGTMKTGKNLKSHVDVENGVL